MSCRIALSITNILKTLALAATLSFLGMAHAQSTDNLQSITNPAPYALEGKFDFTQKAGIVNAELTSVAHYFKVASGMSRREQFALCEKIKAREPGALASLQEAARNQDISAERIVGDYYRQGTYLKKNPEEALAWFRKAGEQGDPSSQYFAGVMLRDGEGVVKDEVQARYWFGKGADIGLPVAANALGEMMLDGRGGPVNKEQAFAYFAQGANPTSPVFDRGAQLNLAQAYANGLAGPPDLVQAVKWLIVATRDSGGKLKTAIVKLQTQLSAKLSEAEIKQAQALADAWFTAHPLMVYPPP